MGASLLNWVETPLHRKANPGPRLSPQESTLKRTASHILVSLILFFLLLLSVLTTVISASSTNLQKPFLFLISVVQKSWGFGVYNGVPFPLHLKNGSQIRMASADSVKSFGGTESHSQPLEYNHLLFPESLRKLFAITNKAVLPSPGLWWGSSPCLCI